MKMLLPAMREGELQRLRHRAPALEFLVARDRQEATALAPQVHASFTFYHPELVDAAPHLRWVQTRSAGVDSCPFGQFRARGITLTNARDIYGIQLADHTLALILAFSRQLPLLFRAQQRQEWVSRHTFPPGELAGQTLLVVGLGGTGLETARRAAGFGMRVLATRRRTDKPKPAFVEALHQPKDLHRLLPEADWVAVCVPLTPRTRDLFGDREFALMKQSAYIVCVTRGGIINTEALLRALEAGSIAGAGLDVTDPEPLPAGHPLWSRPEVIITPHASGHSPHADARMHELLCENAKRFSRGEALINVVDLELEY
jgi:phosphoglycerate dehydrogenase-like enzyme